MQRFKVYVDAENARTHVKSKPKERDRQVLGEIKNKIVTRSKYLEVNNEIQNVQLNESLKPKPNKTILPRKVITKNVTESSCKQSKSPVITRKRRLSSLFRVSEYANDIYKYLLRIEDKYPIKKCDKFENKFGENTRFALVDWLVEINEHFMFAHETLQLCVSIIDRYIQEDKSLSRNELQLIGLAAAFIAYKYEEIIPMEINDLIYVCDSVLSTEDILNMEIKIVAKMQYCFGRPVPAHFIRRYCHVVEATNVEQFCAFYLSDVALMSYNLCHLKPSIIASSAFYIALCVSKGQVDKNLWNSRLIKYSTYELCDFEDCTIALAKCFKRLMSTKFQAVHRKYSRAKDFCVSQMPELLTIIDSLAM